MELHKYKINPALSVKIDSSNALLSFGAGLNSSRQWAEASAEDQQLLRKLCQPGARLTEDFFSPCRAFFEWALKNSIILRDEPSSKRFSRHEIYYSLAGAEGEQTSQLAKSVVGIIGVGGIGSTSAELLARAGVGHLKLIDGDRVELSNLTRGIPFDEENVGVTKVEAVENRIKAVNSKTGVSGVAEFFADKKEHFEFLKDCDILLLSGDRPECIQIANRLSLQERIPLLQAGYVETKATIGPLILPPSTGCLNCEYLWAVDRNSSAALDNQNQNFQAASYGPANNLSLSIASNEIIRFLLGMPCELFGQRLIIDTLTYETLKQPLTVHEECSCH